MQESIKIPNSKSQNIAAVDHRPMAANDKLAILCPGFLDTKDYAHLVGLAEALTQEGYTVVRFDPTGTWESEGDMSEYMTSQYIDDIGSILDHMLKESSYGHILLAGHSRGGMVSLLYTARDPRVSAVVAIMASSGRSMTEERRRSWKEDGYKISTRDIPGSTELKEFRVPYSHVEDRDMFEVSEDVKNIHVPAVFIAGELDYLVPPEDVKAIYDNAHEPKKFIVIPGVGHDYRLNANEIETVNAAVVQALKPMF